MISHVVLIAPRPGLSPEDRERFVAALERAARDIPTVRQVRVGRRVRHGQQYEARMPADFPYAAILDFDDLNGLQAYLDHPAHADLGAVFGDSLSAALVYDYEMEGVEAIRSWPLV